VVFTNIETKTATLEQTGNVKAGSGNVAKLIDKVN
jgi:hypothetical protein